MSQVKTLRRVIGELERYFRVYGDCPCYVAMGETITPITNTALGSTYLEEYSRESTPASMNIVILCDDEAYRIAQEESNKTDALTDSTYDE